MKKLLILFCILLAAGAYCGGWLYAAREIGRQIDALYIEAQNAGIVIEGNRPAVSGFPGPHTVTFSGRIRNHNNGVAFPLLKISGLFLPGHLVHIEAPKGAFALGTYDREIWSLDAADITARIPAALPASLHYNDMKAWRDAGGTLEVKSFDLKKRELDATGSGLAALDDELQPAGNLAVAITGNYVSFIAFLKDKGMIGKGEAFMSAAVLTGMTHKNPDTGANEVAASFMLKNRTLYLGGLRLVELPEAVWPD
jgi:hypothetical protein